MASKYVQNTGLLPVLRAPGPVDAGLAAHTTGKSTREAGAGIYKRPYMNGYKRMTDKDLDSSESSDTLQVDCPACPGRFAVVELISVDEVHCPRCGNDWRVRIPDVPGRVLLDLLSLNEQTRGTGP